MQKTINFYSATSKLVLFLLIFLPFFIFDSYRSSLLEDDVLPTQSLYIGVPSNSHSTNNMMDFRSNSCDTDGVGSLKCFKNANNGYAHLSKRTSRNNSDQTCPSVKVRLLSNLVPQLFIACMVFVYLLLSNDYLT